MIQIQLYILLEPNLNNLYIDVHTSESVDPMLTNRLFGEQKMSPSEFPIPLLSPIKKKEKHFTFFQELFVITFLT